MIMEEILKFELCDLEKSILFLRESLRIIPFFLKKNQSTKGGFSFIYCYFFFLFFSNQPNLKKNLGGGYIWQGFTPKDPHLIQQVIFFWDLNLYLFSSLFENIERKNIIIIVIIIIITISMSVITINMSIIASIISVITIIVRVSIYYCLRQQLLSLLLVLLLCLLLLLLLLLG